MKEKKCPSCHKWNSGEVSVCSFCEQPMDKNVIIYNERKKKGLIPVFKKNEDLFTFKPEDPIWKKTLYSILRPIYLAFFGFISFLMVLVAWASA
jgi:hypothetical protein